MRMNVELMLLLLISGIESIVRFDKGSSNEVVKALQNQQGFALRGLTNPSKMEV